MQVRHRPVKLIGLVLVALASAAFVPALQGCATVDSVRDTPITYGTPRLFTGEYKTIIQASRKALTDGGLSTELDYAVDDHTWMLLGKDGADMTSWGSYVRLVVEKQAGGAYVRLYAKKAMATNVTAKDDYQEVFDRIAANLPRTPTAPAGNATPVLAATQVASANPAPAATAAPVPAASVSPAPAASAQ
ncbi:hypothetical protein LZC95_03565 [Pendulispora brunnea]|uniref:Uncharacterized protein n=1 Tax=Pendulispora brunnea TaxID=2905690 RepID=A0ABZ2KCU6_9BACT